MPTRTELPTISITWTTISSPSMIFSPGRRVMMSMKIPPWKASRRTDQKRRGCAARAAALSGRRLGLGVGEQRGADGSVPGLVDDLVALTLRDEDRRAQVRAEVGQFGAGADGDPHGHVVALEALAVGVRQLDLVVGEELPRVGHGQRQRRIIQRVQPRERPGVVFGDDRPAAAAQPDKAGGELDDRAGLDLEAAE